MNEVDPISSGAAASRVTLPLRVGPLRWPSGLYGPFPGFLADARNRYCMALGAVMEAFCRPLLLEARLTRGARHRCRGIDWLARLFAGLLYGVSPYDPAALGATTLLFATVAF
jgi:hypothetical protein